MFHFLSKLINQIKSFFQPLKKEPVITITNNNPFPLRIKKKKAINLKRYNSLPHVKKIKRNYYLQNKEALYERKKKKRAIIKLVKLLQAIKNNKLALN